MRLRCRNVSHWEQTVDYNLETYDLQAGVGSPTCIYMWMTHHKEILRHVSHSLRSQEGDKPDTKLVLEPWTGNSCRENETYWFFERKKRPFLSYSSKFGNFLSTHQIFIPHICHRHHRRCLCKFFLSGVNFSRMNAKNVKMCNKITLSV